MSSTSHRAASATSENTPLLVDHDDNARDASEHEDCDRDHDESVPKDILSPTSRNFFIALLFATLLCSLAFASLSIAAFFMLRFGESRFGASDYYIDGALVTGLTVLGLAGAGHGVYNIVRLFKFQLAKLPSLRILAIASACLSLVAAFSLAPYYLDLDGWYCSRDRLNEPWYPGTWEECKRWESAYMAVCFTMVVTLGLNAIFSIVFVFTAFSIARARSTEPNPNWTISPGYFSFEFKLRWGTERADHERQQHPPRGNEINDERTEPVPVGTESA